MTCLSVEHIREDIFETIQSKLRYHIVEYDEVHLGYKNLKWILHTDKGKYFVKQYSKERYPEMSNVKKTLQYQQYLQNEGIPCPSLISHHGEHILYSSQGERFVMMECCDGKVLEPGTVNVNQMYYLGKNISLMHQLLNKVSKVNTRLHWNVSSKELLLKSCQHRLKEAESLNRLELMEALEKQRAIIQLADDMKFTMCEKGISHWDLFNDNLLFQPNTVSAILDFDRMNYVYREFDISRPILSLCLTDDTFNASTISAFVSGFNEHATLSLERLVLSIKLTWWKESEWLSLEKEEDSAALKRFRKENKIVANHWEQLEEVLAEAY